VVQVLSNLNENFFDFFDFVVKKFCGSSLVLAAGLVDFLAEPERPQYGITEEIRELLLDVSAAEADILLKGV
jgi:hypothetical protein